MLLRATFQKKLADISFDVIDVVVGFDSAECQIRVSVSDSKCAYISIYVCL